jgi:purine-binding chemotaxis protein CheW
MSVGNLFDTSSNVVDDQDYEGSYLRCVLFKLETEKYGINVQRVREVLRVGEIRPVPGCPFDVLGVINVRGVIVTVLDTRQFFKLYSGAVTDLSRIIIIEQQDQVLGLLVDEVEEVRDIQENHIDSVGAIGDDSNNRMIQGIAHVGNEGVIIIIEPEQFFDVGNSGHSLNIASGSIDISAGDDDLF